MPPDPARFRRAPLLFSVLLAVVFWPGQSAIAQGTTADDTTCTGDPDCDDGNECTVCICDPDDPDADAKGCVCESVTDGTACSDDGFACTQDVCAGGECSVPDDANCNDGVACTVDVCDPSDPDADTDGCVFIPDDDACDDGNPCTVCTCDPDDPAANVEGCVCLPVPIPCTATSAGSGDWTNPASWSISGAGCPAGVYPDNDKCFTWTVFIQSNHEITLNADITIDELILDGTGADLDCVDCTAPPSSGGSSLLGGNTPPILRIPLEFAFSAGVGAGGVAAQGSNGSLRVLGNLDTPGVAGTLCVSCDGTQAQCNRAPVNVRGAFDPQASDCFGFQVCEDPDGVHLFPQGVDPIIACCLPGKLQCTKLPLEECLAIGGSPHCDKSCAAVVAEGLCVGAIPAVSTWGLLLTGLLILTAASIVCRPPRRAAA